MDKKVEQMTVEELNGLRVIRLRQKNHYEYRIGRVRCEDGEWGRAHYHSE